MKENMRLSKNSPCAALKSAFNECFNKWYGDKFLKGQWEKDECFHEWEAYRTCVLRRMEEKKLSHLFQIEATMYAKNEE
ncbi:hypothetical protein KP509_22G057700 [Ceratopteris richardii]|uniref:Uncharacterized protein n=1 Tax=Ceratopteris richardii TaxID=49495 RepID=A0A8T2S7H6_CERRI|nr:hypothetical protein KP509_22G057700 [Ceratopteris richardii]